MQRERNNPERVYVEYLKGVCYFEEVSEFSKDQEKPLKQLLNLNL